MKLEPYFHDYELLVEKVEQAFRNMKEKHGECIKCEVHCSDCCNAVFGLFLIEALYIRKHFEETGEDRKRRILERAEIADRNLESIQDKLKSFKNDPQMQAYVFARERVRCPMLDDGDECMLYQRRPITCRVYGIPTKIHGKVRVCGKSEFKSGATYPALDLDAVYRDLFILSKEILEDAGVESEDKASLLISMAKAVQTPFDDLIKEDFR